MARIGQSGRLLAATIAAAAALAAPALAPAADTPDSPPASADADGADSATSTSLPAPAGGPEARPVWFWPLVLFALSFAIGVVAVLGGVGGGVLYVPIVSGFLPFHLDFVRCSGLLIALSASITAGPGLLKKGLASLRLAMPLALVASAGAVAGAMLGLALPAALLETALGVLILGVTVLMAASSRSEYPEVDRPDRLAALLGIAGVYHEPTSDREVAWRVHRMPAGLAVFAGIGVLGGVFGVGAGWASVPTINLLLGAPLKLSVATSVTMIAMTSSTASWVYINNGAALPLLVVPSAAGMMLGSRLGARLLTRSRPRAVRYAVLGLLAFAGARMLLKGLGIW